MMLNFKGTFAGAVLVGMSVLSTSALATPVNTGEKAKIVGFEYDNPIKVNIEYGSSHSTVKAGGYEGVWLNGESFAAFCVEITQSLAPLGKYNSYSETSFSSAITSNLTNLANKYYSFVNDAVSSAAFQVAIWEIVTETKTGLNLDKGYFQADNTTTTTKQWVPVFGGLFGYYKNVTVDDPNSLAAINLAKTWLAGVNDSSVANTGDYSLTVLKNKSYQDLVVFTPIVAVPEPATYGMLALGLGLIAMLARRRRTDSIRF